MTRPPTSRILVALVPAALLPVTASLFYFVLFSDQPWARVLYGATKVFTLLWPLLAVRFLLGESLHNPLGNLRGQLRAVPLGAFVGLLVVGLMAGLMATPAGAVVLQSAGTIRAKAEQLGILNHYVIFAVFLSFVNSAVEEFYWRWFVYGQLRRLLPGWRAHALAGAAFAAHHVVVVTQFFPLMEALSFGVAVGLGGVIMSLLYERQRTLAGAWVCHLVVDLGIMGIGYGLLFY
jgi:membrane protease YdiL (CAAX protease family)